MMIRKEDVKLVPGIVHKGNRIEAPGIILEDMGPLVGEDDGFDDDCDLDYDDNPPPSRIIRKEDVKLVPGIVHKGNRIESSEIILEDIGPLVGDDDDGFDDDD